MKQKKIIISVPRLIKARFEIEVNGKKCRNTIDSSGRVKFNDKDYKGVDYYAVTNIKPTLDIIEKILTEVFEPIVFSSNAGSKKDGTKNKNNGI